MKTVREVAVQLENTPGALSAIVDLLGAAGIAVLAVFARAAGPVGSVNFVAPDPDRAVAILQGAGYKPTVQEILAVEMPRHPGGLNTLLKALKSAGVNVEYLYSWIGASAPGCSPIVFLGVNDRAAAYDALAREWIRMYDEELYRF